MTTNFILFTTCDSDEARVKDLIRLLGSTAEVKNGLILRHYILLQRAESLPEALTEFQDPSRVFLFINARVSLSRARNIMLNHAAKENVTEDKTIFAFPDDDAWYPKNLLMHISNIFKSTKELDIFVCNYGSSPVLIDESDKVVFTLSNRKGLFIQNASSNTLFLRSSILNPNSFFDENLGVGAPINGGEDLDYALRALELSSGDFGVCKQKLVGHRDKVTWVRSRYYSGSLFAIARAANANKAVVFSLIRKVFVGVFFVAKCEMSLFDYLRQLKVGLAGYFNSKVRVDTFK